MNEAERKAVRRMNRTLSRWMAGMIDSGRIPGGKTVINPGGGVMDLRRGQRSHLYWQDDRGWMYAYTPWKDRDGNYWTWTYKPVGKGARSGKPRRWKAIQIVSARSRKTAMKRAERRYERAQERLS